MTVAHMIEVKGRHKLSYRSQCLAGEVAYSSFKRWKGRHGRGEALVQRPGPKKTALPDLNRLYEEIAGLRHGRKRSLGTGDLYSRYAGEISRRRLQEMVRQVRSQSQKDLLDDMKRLTWHRAGLVWCVDDSQYHRRPCRQKLFLHNTQDLGSRYKLRPAITEALLAGDRVAANLERLFREHAAPLFLKRDNGGNLNHADVNEVLSRALVIPINSPAYYAQYNGGIERAQHELKRAIRKRDASARRVAVARVQEHAEIAAHDLNHTVRPVLGRRTACEAFQSSRSQLREYNRARRRQVYDWIRELALRIMDQAKSSGKSSAQTAWRVAAENWLQQNGVITVAARGKVLPIFPEKRAHK
jgi:hypothetical protein